MISERAFAKVNLVLHVARPRPDGWHPLCSLFASVELADELRVEEAGGDHDEVVCPAVDGQNLAAGALAAFRDAVDGALPPLRVEIDKRVPVAAGLGGGSADAAACLRAANRLAGRPLDDAGLRDVAARLGSDVPSQVQPAHALVQGVGDRVERLELPELWLVLVPREPGLLTREVYAELDRLGLGRRELDPETLRAAAGASPEELAAAVANDLQPAVLSLRPELEQSLDALRAEGALAAAVTGSGPTVFGLFAERNAAERAAAGIEGALVSAGRRT